MRRFVTLLLVFTALVVLVSPCVQSKPTTELHDCDAGSCALPEAAVAGESAAGAPQAREVFGEENWQFSTPFSGWERTKSNSPDIKLVLANAKEECLVIILKEETGDSFGQYIIGSIRAFVVSGYRVSAIKQVKLNNIPFVEVQINSSDATVWAWITVKDGFGYGFSCGGDINPDAGTTLHDLCQNIANTFEVK
jgi:hypothetical protein